MLRSAYGSLSASFSHKSPIVSRSPFVPQEPDQFSESDLSGCLEHYPPLLSGCLLSRCLDISNISMSLILHISHLDVSTSHVWMSPHLMSGHLHISHLDVSTSHIWTSPHYIPNISIMLVLQLLARLRSILRCCCCCSAPFAAAAAPPQYRTLLRFCCCCCCYLLHASVIRILPNHTSM